MDHSPLTTLTMCLVTFKLEIKFGRNIGFGSRNNPTTITKRVERHLFLTVQLVLTASL